MLKKEITTDISFILKSNDYKIDFTSNNKKYFEELISKVLMNEL